VVFSGAGAAGVSCADFFIQLGVNPKNIIMCDSRGVLHSERANIDTYRSRFITQRAVKTLEEAMQNADVFIGVSAAGVVSQKMIASMAENPIVFAMANPDPEISWADVMEVRNDVIMATGRSDYPNQVNNVLGFPFIFRGALDVCATDINDAMKIAAAHALANLAKISVPQEVSQAYNIESLHFSRNYIIPKPLDPRVIEYVAPAVALAAMQSGVATRPIHNMEAYRAELRQRMQRNKTISEFLNNINQM